jgi:hypothetical protein
MTRLKTAKAATNDTKQFVSFVAALKRPLIFMRLNAATGAHWTIHEVFEIRGNDCVSFVISRTKPCLLATIRWIYTCVDDTGDIQDVGCRSKPLKFLSGR